MSEATPIEVDDANRAVIGDILASFDAIEVKATQIDTSTDRGKNLHLLIREQQARTMRAWDAFVLPHLRLMERAKEAAEQAASGPPTVPQS